MATRLFSGHLIFTLPSALTPETQGLKILTNTFGFWLFHLGASAANNDKVGFDLGPQFDD
jgi:hypothetical protein